MFRTLGPRGYGRASFHHYYIPKKENSRFFWSFLFIFNENLSFFHKMNLRDYTIVFIKKPR